MSRKKDYIESMFDARYRRPLENRLSEAELKDFDLEIQRFKKKKWVDFPQRMEINWFDEWAWLRSKGAAGKNKEVIVTNFTSAVYNPNGTLKSPADCDPILFEQLQKDLRQYYVWKERKAYGETKRLEGLQELYETENFATQRVENSL